MGIRHLLRGGLLNPTSGEVGDASRVPAAYDERLVPPLFGPWAEALVRRLAPARGIRALDVATGPGTVARVLAAAIGPAGQVVGCDASPSMIARAREKGVVPGGAPVAWTVAPAAPLPWPSNTFSLVTCQQGLQFVPDAAAALTEMRRVLVPGGRVAASVWASLEACPVFAAFREALLDAGQPELAALMQIPFPRWTSDDLAARARELGFGYIQVVEETRELVFPGGPDVAVAAFHGTPIGPALEALPETSRQKLLTATRARFAPLTRHGAVGGPMTARILLATA